MDKMSTSGLHKSIAFRYATIKPNETVFDRLESITLSRGQVKSLLWAIRTGLDNLEGEWGLDVKNTTQDKAEIRIQRRDLRVILERICDALPVGGHTNGTH